MPSTRTHAWVIAPSRRDRDRAALVDAAPALSPALLVDCHRHHRGPYTGAGELARALLSEAGRAPERLQAHALTLLSVSPEVERLLPISVELGAWLRLSREGNARAWTLRLAHGMVDFLLERARDRSLRAIRFEGVEGADPTDRELIALLLSRADPAELAISVGTSDERLDDPLAAALAAHARVQRPAPAAAEAAASAGDARARLAEAYVASDCSADDPRARDAYHALDPERRRALHRARAASLEAAAEPSLALGAIPLHRERADAAVGPLLAASQHCMRMAYYDACLDLSKRGAALVDRRGQLREHGELGRNLVFSLLLLGRLDEMERYCREVVGQEGDPALRSHCAYAMAIANARFYPSARRDYPAARSWIERAIAWNAQVAPSDSQLVNAVFLENTLALVEMRTSHPERALELLSSGLQQLAERAPARYPVESTILLHNRARLHVAAERPEQAIDDYTALLRNEPSNSEAHLDRGLAYQRLGRLEEALADYDQAIAWSPPYAVVHFNRAQVRAALGRTDEALADYGRVLTLDPGYVAALVNRAGLNYRRGERAAARADVERALALAPDSAIALGLLGLLEQAAGRRAEAEQAFTRALERDPTERTALINRAALRFGRRDHAGALDDLGRAIQLGDDATARYNRARILQSLGRSPEAEADYARALDLGGAPSDATDRLARCRRAIEASPTAGGRGSGRWRSRR